MTLDDILARLDNVQGHGEQRSARCPAHDDHANSLSVSAGKDGRILLKCHAGCIAEEINGVLRSMDGWEHTKKATRFGCYGAQKGFIRREDTADKQSAECNFQV